MDRIATFLCIIIFLSILTLSSCEENAKSSSPAIERCGNGICDATEQDRGLCPEDCSAPSSDSETVPSLPSEAEDSSPLDTYDIETYEYAPVDIETAWIAPVSSTKITETEDTTRGITVSEYIIINPTSGAELMVVVYAPTDASSTNQYPSIILVPGGIGTKDHFVNDAQQYAREGFISLIFDADGRGESTGTEDYNGYVQQDGLYELYRFLTDYEGVDSANIGIISFSYGVTMATGMLARYQPDIKFYIEWEGPVNRYYTTVGCVSEGRGAVRSGTTCDDEAYWGEREALRFVPYLPVDYFLIVQRQDDHVQSTVQHSVDVNNLAIQYLDWVRVNGPENAINKEYTTNTMPVLEGSEYKIQILAYTQEIVGK